jgi:hypothetical protein
MRLIPAICGLAALALAQSAAAVTVGPIAFSPEFETELQENLGPREGEVLRRDVERAVASELARRGLNGSNATIEIVIEDADPNRPTMHQLGESPGLDPMRSISIGGASLHGVIRAADGQVLSEVDHDGYRQTFADIAFIPPATTWSEARRDIRRFATKVADAYAAHASH